MAAADVLEPPAVPWAWIEAVHDGALVARIRDGELTLRESRGLGLPWSPELVERARRAVAGSVEAARHAVEHGLGMNLGGGTHHAGRDFARGYCLFNDVGVALARLRADGLARRALVVDCDVHQGDGTAQLFADDAETFTLSLHGARNYPFQRIPSDLDVDLATGTGDADYLAALDEALDVAIPRARARARLLPRGRRPLGGRPARPPRAHQGRACAPATSSSSTACARRAPPSASSWPAATPRTSATRSTSTPPRRRRWRAVYPDGSSLGA